MIVRHTERGPWTRALRMAAIAALAFGATAAGAAEVSEVRVGTHEQHTRIVLELDGATGYRLEAPQPGAKPELVLSLDATSVARDVPSKSPLVRKVHVEPTGAGSVVRVQLATADVSVKEMLLANPPRLVFDLKARGPLPKDIEPVEAVAEAPAAAPAAEPVEIAKAEPAVVPAPVQVEPARAESPAEAEPSAAPAPIEAVPPPSEPTPVAAADVQPEVKPEPKPAPIAVTPPPAAKPADAKARRDAITAKAHETQTSSSWMALLMSPLGLGALAGVIIVGALVAMRRRRASEDEDPLYTVMAADDAAASADAEDAREPAHAERAPVLSVESTWGDPNEVSEPALRDAGAPRQLHFGRTAQADAPDAVEATSIEAPDAELASEPAPFLRGSDPSDSLFDDGPGAIPETQTQPVIPAAPAAEPPVAPLSTEMERRIGELERRLEQLTEARERLERQVAAQTEELRVQRAAIARTQRVVRSIAKTEDLATEPVPRAPSVS